jgi:hypothetical protein
MATETLPVIQHAIQLAVAPVFLLTGVAGMLGVMANRLARIIDRSRDLKARWSSLSDRARAEAGTEIMTLERRRVFSSWAINFCTGAALLVCLCIVTLFTEEFFDVELRWFVGVQFVGGMLALIGGLSCFLREVYLATHTMRIEIAQFER